MSAGFREKLTYPSLVISVSLCTRMYGTDENREIGDLCENSQTEPADTTAKFCKDTRTVYDKTKSKVHPTQITAYSPVQGDQELVVTWDDSNTIWMKYCKVSKQYYSDFKLGLAIFDVECEDWGNECGNVKDLHLAGTERIKDIANKIRTVAKDKAAALTC
ncbi:uncharacterized protein LOC144144566 [Haemaphysalis longicornis]